MLNTRTMESQQSSLSDDFNFIAKGFKWAAFGLASFFVFGYLDNFFFDPFFFDAIHNTENATAQALKAFLVDNFGWVHDIFGLTGDSGLLHMDWAQNILAPYYDLTSKPEIDDFLGADIFGYDDLLDSPDDW